MNTLNLFAQTYSQTYTMSDSEAAAVVALVVFVYGVLFIATLVTYVITSLSLMRIFSKAGVKQWIAWVPFYNYWKTLEIGGQQGFWAVLAIIPFVNIVSAVFLIIAQYHIGKKLGKSGLFVLWAIFLPFVWYIWLAVDKSKWNDKASSAPSLHTPTPAA